jgi:hypothetical protein
MRTRLDMIPNWWHDGVMREEVKFTLRLPAEIRNRVANQAIGNFRSINSEILAAIAEHLHNESERTQHNGNDQLQRTGEAGSGERFPV